MYNVRALREALRLITGRYEPEVFGLRGVVLEAIQHDLQPKGKGGGPQMAAGQVADRRLFFDRHWASCCWSLAASPTPPRFALASTFKSPCSQARVSGTQIDILCALGKLLFITDKFVDYPMLITDNESLIWTAVPMRSNDTKASTVRVARQA